MNNRTQILKELKNMHDEPRDKDEVSLSNINRKNTYNPPSIHLLGEVVRITAGNGNGEETDVFAPHNPMS